MGAWYIFITSKQVGTGDFQKILTEGGKGEVQRFVGTVSFCNKIVQIYINLFLISYKMTCPNL